MTNLKTSALSLWVVALLSAQAATAANFNVMAIGDSITRGYGYGYKTPSGGATDSIGGWRVPLAGLLAADNCHLTDTTFSFIGTQRDGSGNTNNAHEGYNGYAISPAAAAGKTVDGYISEALATGKINPTNADIVMLHIGTNGNKSGDKGQVAVNELGSLISTLMNSFLNDPTDLLLVSTLTPVQRFRKPYSSSVYPDDPANGWVDEFNQRLLDTLFGGAWDAGKYSSGTVAEHMSFGDRVLLLDLNSAINSGAAEGSLLFKTYNDYLHPTTAGNQMIAQFYYDRFVELGIGETMNVTTNPTPTTGAIAVALMLAYVFVRPYRRAA